MSAFPGSPEGFLWGAATSAYAIEGSPLADGAGASLWHRFAHTPGWIEDGATGDVACDHYRRFREDVALVRELGLRAYRFEVAWARVVPEGKGPVNVGGLDFYQRLVDELLEHGITPFVTLQHLDLPAALEDLGGWRNRDMVSWFADYASRVVRTLDDRVPLWATLEDPWSLVNGGYLQGVLAPGRRSAAEAARVTHHLLLAHATAVEAYRAEGRNRIGIVVDLAPEKPASVRRQYLDPIFLGRYPEEMEELFGHHWPEISPTDLARIRIPLDFLAVDHDVEAPGTDDRSAASERGAILIEALSSIPKLYGAVPTYVTTSCATLRDPLSKDEEYEDPRRVAMLRDHVEAVHRAIGSGVDVRGYFVRSLLDGFEWDHGFSKRRGIVHVDRVTQRRTPKASARFLSGWIRSGGAAL